MPFPNLRVRTRRTSVHVLTEGRAGLHHKFTGARKGQEIFFLLAVCGEWYICSYKCFSRLKSSSKYFSGTFMAVLLAIMFIPLCCGSQMAVSPWRNCFSTTTWASSNSTDAAGQMLGWLSLNLPQVWTRFRKMQWTKWSAPYSTMNLVF